MSRKLNRIIFPLVAFVSLVALACTCGGFGATPAPTEAPSGGGGGVLAPTEEPSGGGGTIPTAPPTEASGGGGGGVDTEFPMPDDAHTITNVGGNLNFQTSLPLKDVPDYYRKAFPDYTERTLLTSITDVAISMVFDGHPSGNAIVVQAVDLGGSTNINIRLEAIP